MANNLLSFDPFEFDGAQVRATVIDGEPYFVARDVAAILGYAKPRNAVSDHCKGARIQGIPSAGGVQDMTVIPERDVYRLIMRSKLAAAERFENWVVGEVLPSIRKTGAYAVAPSFQVPQTLGEALRLAADLEEQRVALALENEAKAKVIEQQKPHVEHSQALLASDEVLSVAEMAKKINQAGYPMGQNRLYTALVEDGILMKDKMPYQRYAHWFFIETDTWIDHDGKPHSKHVLRVNAKGEAALLKKYAPKRCAIQRKPNPPKTGLFKPRRKEEGEA